MDRGQGPPRPFEEPASDDRSVRFPVGYASKQFVTDVESGLAILSQPVILVVRGALRSMGPLVPILQQLQPVHRSLLVAAGSVQGDALGLLTANKASGRFASSAVNFGLGPEGTAMLEALAAATGAQVVDGEATLALGRAMYGGEAEEVTSDETSTTVVPSKRQPVAGAPGGSSAGRVPPESPRRFGRRRRR